MNNPDLTEIVDLLNRRQDQLTRESNRCRQEGKYMDVAGFTAMMDGVGIARNDIRAYFRNKERRATKTCRDGHCVFNYQGHCKPYRYAKCTRRLSRKRRKKI